MSFHGKNLPRTLGPAVGSGSDSCAPQRRLPATSRAWALETRTEGCRLRVHHLSPAQKSGFLAATGLTNILGHKCFRQGLSLLLTHQLTTPYCSHLPISLTYVTWLPPEST